MQSSSPVPVRRPFLKLMYTLLLTGVALVWLMQRSISNYWLEVHHQELSLPVLQDSLVWQAGGALQHDWMRYQNAGVLALAKADEQMRERFNQAWLPATAEIRAPGIRAPGIRTPETHSPEARPHATRHPETVSSEAVASEAVPAPSTAVASATLSATPSLATAATGLTPDWPTPETPSLTQGSYVWPTSPPPRPSIFPTISVPDTRLLLSSAARAAASVPPDAGTNTAIHATLHATINAASDAATHVEPQAETSAETNAGVDAGSNAAAAATARVATPAESALSASAPETPVPASPPAKITLHAGDTVFFVGDSMMQGVAPHVRKTLFKTHGIESLDLSKQSSGLAYTGFFNWPATVENTLASHPDIRLIVVFLGPNDPWDFPLVRGQPFLRFKSAEWEAAYRDRIRAVLDSARQHQAHVMWLEVPAMKKDTLNQAMNYLNTLYASEVTQAGGQFVALNGLLGNEGGVYSAHAQVGERRLKVRIDDGIHFTVAGQRLIADSILDRIEVAPAPEASE